MLDSESIQNVLDGVSGTIQGTPIVMSKEQWNSIVAAAELPEDVDPENYIRHYGVGHLNGGHSGRYPWGSGDRPFQTSGDFKSRVQELKKKGLSEREIARELHIGTTDKNGVFTPSVGKLRIQVSLANFEERSAKVAKAKELYSAGYSVSAIGREMNLNESSVRSLLNENAEARMNKAQETANLLRQEIDSKGMIDVGEGWAQQLGVSQEKFNEALYILELDGYEVYNARMEQVTNPGKYTILKVAAPPGTEHREVYDFGNIHTIGDYISEDNGDSFKPAFAFPESLDSKRLEIRYKEDGGDQYDGLIELRRGVEDISLGDAAYSQVRILVDGTHYLKGMAAYADDLPPGVDVRFNTNKSKEKSMMEVLKPVKTITDENGNTVVDARNPFGSLIKEKGGQSYYIGADGKEHLRVINKRADEGDWDDWADKLPSQFASKQPYALAEKQANLALADKHAEYESILALENPTVRKVMLDKFADECDSTAVRLNTAALPGQRYQVILPVNSLKDNEVYAPNYKPGTTLALIRYPHGGRFEIPLVMVTDKNEEGRKRIGNTARDAIGINHNVAARLSGADFDGDTVMVIPLSGRTKVSSQPPLKGLEGFDPSMAYPERKGMRYMKDPKTGKDSTQMEMGVISNLITDMTLKGATPDELAKAVRHSMVVIDAAKHKLDYKQSEKDNDIALLKKKYQGHTDEKGSYREGASTLISSAKSTVRIPERKEGAYLTDPQTGKSKKYYVDPKTGEKLYTETGRTYTQVWNPNTSKWDSTISKNGQLYTKDPEGKYTVEVPPTAKLKVKRAETVTTKMENTSDARTLISDRNTAVEILYARYANELKGMGNEARRVSVNTVETKRNPAAAKKYEPEVESIKKKLAQAEGNAPRERRAQMIANSQVKAVKQANPMMTPKDLKKYKAQAIQTARNQVGAKRSPIALTDMEWEAIQSGAIGYTTLKKITKHIDDETLKGYAMPKTATFSVSPAKVQQMKAMQAAGYTTAQIGERFGVSSSSVSRYLRDGV